MSNWLNRIAELLEAETADLRELAHISGGDPESFYIGTCIDGADLRGQDLVGMTFGTFNPASVLIDERTQLSDALRDLFEPPPQTPAARGDGSAPTRSSAPLWADSALAVELDGATTRIYRKGVGLVLDEPSLYLARVGRESRAMAAGAEAVAGAAASPQKGGRLVSPFIDGKLADERLGVALMRSFLKQALGRSRIGADVVASVPAQASPVQRRAVANVMKAVGARSVGLVDRGFAAAVGAGLPVHEARGVLVVDVGSVTTDIAVVCLSGTVVSETLRVGTSTMNAAIAELIERLYSVKVSDDQAEQMRLVYGSARYRSDGAQSLLVGGSGLTKDRAWEKRIPVDTISLAMVEPIGQIIDALKRVIEVTPPELAGELADDGVTLTGVGATIPQLDAELRDHTGLNVQIAPDPHLCVVLGGGKILEHPRWRKGIVAV